jgi:predicted thioesterase
VFKVGLQNEMQWRVKAEHLASALGSGLVDVLATPVLVGFCEECARLTVDPLLPAQQKTVGTHIDLRHFAATPQGLKVNVRAKLIGINDKRLQFDIEAWDEVEKICEASHERHIIDPERFARRIAVKKPDPSQTRAKGE